jgi:hypothetical protein
MLLFRIILFLNTFLGFKLMQERQKKMAWKQSRRPRSAAASVGGETIPGSFFGHSAPQLTGLNSLPAAPNNVHITSLIAENPAIAHREAAGAKGATAQGPADIGIVVCASVRPAKRPCLTNIREDPKEKDGCEEKGHFEGWCGTWKLAEVGTVQWLSLYVVIERT